MERGSRLGAIALAHRGVFAMEPRVRQALAWEVNDSAET